MFSNKVINRCKRSIMMCIIMSVCCKLSINRNFINFFDDKSTKKSH